MQLRLGANTQEEIDNSKGLFVYFNVPHDTPEIRENIRGLILCLARARFYVDNPLKNVRASYTARALDGIEVHFMSDELLNRGVNSLVEIEFTLKSFLTQFGSDKSVKFFIDKPEQPAIDPVTGEWDLSDNKEITVNRGSVLEASSLLETNNIAELFAIATLDDGTLQLPDLNPFNLESKLDQIRTDINTSQLHFTGGFTTLMNWFAASFRETPYKLNNPFSENTFYNIFSTTFNKGTVTYLDQIIPDWLTGWIPGWIPGWSLTASIPVFQSEESYIKQANDNFVTTFNETNTDGVASNSYFRYLHTWLSVDWLTFHNLMETMRDCICAIPTAIGNLELNPTINVPVTNNHPITVNNSNPITIENITPTSTTTNNTTVTTTTTVNNPDGSTTTTTTTNTTPIYEPINPDDPNSPTSEPYSTKYVTPSNSHDEVCGFVFYTMSQLADFVEELISWLTSLNGFITTMGGTAFGAWVITQIDAVAGVYIAKLGLTSIRVISQKWLGLGGIAINFLPAYIREVRDDMACPEGGIVGEWTVNEIKQDMINDLQTLIGQNLVLDFASYLIHLFYDMGLYSPALAVANVNMADYAQYCPCPLTGNFSGHWWNNTTGNGAKHWYITDDTVFITGTHTSQNVFGTVYTSEIQNGIIDPQNPLSASGVLHVISHSGFGDTAFTISINATFTNLYYNGQTYTKV